MDFPVFFTLVLFLLAFDRPSIICQKLPMRMILLTVVGFEAETWRPLGPLFQCSWDRTRKMGLNAAVSLPEHMLLIDGIIAP